MIITIDSMKNNSGLGVGVFSRLAKTSNNNYLAFTKDAKKP
jgi:hypothetical protein